MRATYIALLALSAAAVSAVSAASPSTSTPDHHEPDHFFYKGHDLSSLRLFELSGVNFKDTARKNRTRPAEDILADGGMNTVRLRLWVDPTTGDQWGTLPGFYGLNYTLPLAQRLYSKGLSIYLDLHFSSYWADPTKQTIPTTWPSEPLPALRKTLRRYVNSTLHAFKDAGVDLALVSLGNEITNGILWPQGKVDVDISPASARAQNFTHMAALWASARRGVTDAVASGVCAPQVMIHLDNGWNATLQSAWYAALTATGHVRAQDWDVIGVSFYPFYGAAATLSNLATSLSALAKTYRKPVHVVETDWPAVCTAAEPGGSVQLSDPSVPVSAEGQAEWVGNITRVVKEVPGGWGRGVHYWEPAFVNNTGLGSKCEDAILFGVDWSQWPEVTAYSRSSVGMFGGRG